MIVNVLSGPTHPFANDVTVIVATTGFEVVFNPVNDGIFPFPPAIMPIEGVSFTHENVVPTVVLI